MRYFQFSLPPPPKKKKFLSGAMASSPTLSLPPLQLFEDEIIAILMTTFSRKLSLIDLTAQYNTCFRSDQPRATKEQLLDAIKKLSNFKVKCESLKVIAMPFLTYYCQ